MDRSSMFGFNSRSLTLAFCWLFLLMMLVAGCGVNDGDPNATLAPPTASPTPGAIFAITPRTPVVPASAPTVVGSTPTTPTFVPTEAEPTPSPTPVPAFVPKVLPPGSALPSEAQCAASIQHSSYESRPQNVQANHSVPTAQQIAGLIPWGPSTGQDSQADSFRQQITGNFTGTTDEILQWAGCKWGIDPNLVRAQAIIESYWRQGAQGDNTTKRSLCPPGTWSGSSCYQTYGILQIKYAYFPDTWPMNRDDTAFNAEYVYAQIRACYEGWDTFLSSSTPLPGYPAYGAGDIWGCIGRWYSGGWYDQGAVTYISHVKARFQERLWLQPGF